MIAKENKGMSMFVKSEEVVTTIATVVERRDVHLLKTTAPMSVVPVPEQGQVKIVVGTECKYANRCYFHKNGVAELIGELQAIHDAMK